MRFSCIHLYLRHRHRSYQSLRMIFQSRCQSNCWLRSLYFPGQGLCRIPNRSCKNKSLVRTTLIQQYSVRNTFACRSFVGTVSSCFHLQGALSWQSLGTVLTLLHRRPPPGSERNRENASKTHKYSVPAYKKRLTGCLLKRTSHNDYSRDNCNRFSSINSTYKTQRKHMWFS